MTKYRKKPVVIETTQWFKHGDHPEVYTKPHMKNDLWGYIRTLEGEHIVTPGDWIITGVKGEHYPCKPDIFEMTYELAQSVQDWREKIRVIDGVIHTLEWTPQVMQPAVQPAQEPVACARCKDLEEQAYDLLGKLKVANLKWSVAHPWVGLTDDDVLLLLEYVMDSDDQTFLEFARAVEQALKEKNNG